MNAAADWPERLWRFVVAELEDFPGRGNALLRNLVACTLVIVISISLEVPLLALSLIVVFFVSQTNVVLTRLAGILFIVSTTLAVGLAILLLKFTYGYPLLRILGASVVFIASMFFLRATRLGPLFFLVAIVVIYVQSQVDLIAQPELLLRACLWVWMAVIYPILVTLVVNTLLLPQEPQVQLRDAMRRQLAQIDARLAALGSGREQEAGISPAQVQQGTLSLHKLLKFACMRDADYRAHEARQLVLITCVSRLYAAAAALAPAAPDAEALQAVRMDCVALGQRIAAASYPDIPPLHSAALARPFDSLALEEMRDALRMLVATHAPAAPPVAATKEPLLVSDAFSNPNYLRFAFKTWLASMLCYLFYNAVQWPGIHTVMLTCVIIALPSLGASTQKGLLRIGGCLVGSALALFCIVFVIPRIDDLVGLLAMSLPVIGLGAWVAAGSERISYAGLQILFCFALALLEQFGPTTDLTEIRDRLVGILLGVLVSTLVHGLLWPEREGEGLLRRLAGVLDGIADLLRLAPSDEAQVERLQALNLRSWSQLSDCEATLARVALEPGWQQGEHEELTLMCQTLLAKAREIHWLSVRLQRGRAALGEPPREVEHQEQLAAWLADYAAQLRGENREGQALPLLAAVPQAAAGVEREWLLDLAELRRLLASLPQQSSVEPGSLQEIRP